MNQNSCIFCELAIGELPSTTIFEDENFRVILDIAPAKKGHCILLTKKHMTDLLEISETEAFHALSVASKIANAVKKALSCDGINILQNNGEAAGQTIFHFHIHIIPRFDKDGVTIPWRPLSYQEGEAEEYAERIRRYI